MAEEARNIANGNPGDVDFMGMIQSFRDQRYIGGKKKTGHARFSESAADGRKFI